MSEPWLERASLREQFQIYAVAQQREFNICDAVLETGGGAKE